MEHNIENVLKPGFVRKWKKKYGRNAFPTGAKIHFCKTNNLGLGALKRKKKRGT